MSARTIQEFNLQFSNLRNNSCFNAMSNAMLHYSTMQGQSATVDVILSDAAGWVFEAVKKLEKLADLKPNWDSYGGKALSTEIRHYAAFVINSIRKKDLPDPLVGLCSGGEIQLEWEKDGRELELDLIKHRILEYVKCDSEGVMEEGQEVSNIEDKVNELTDWLATPSS